MFGQFVCHLGSAAKPATSRAEGSAQVSEPPPRKGPAMSGEVKTGTGENDDWDVGDGKNHTGHTGRVFPPQHDPTHLRSRAAAQPRSRAALSPTIISYWTLFPESYGSPDDLVLHPLPHDATPPHARTGTCVRSHTCCVARRKYVCAVVPNVFVGRRPPRSWIAPFPLAPLTRRPRHPS